MPAVLDLSDPTSLVGVWSFDRALVHHPRGPEGRAEGQALVEPLDAGLRWREEGVLVWSGRRFPVRRELALLPGRGGWEVRFDDGRPFHRWAPGERVDHLCAADLYAGRYAPTDDGWSVVWNVRGPGTSWTSTTSYRRLSGPGTPQ